MVTASRISRITDYGCKQTAALFGDLATATLLAGRPLAEASPFFKLLIAFDLVFLTACTLAFPFTLEE